MELADLPAQPPDVDASAVEPIHLPQPTIWPAILGLGITTALAGIVLAPAIVAIGGLVVTIGLIGWIEVLRHAAH